MELPERQKAVADAIILERAARVLRRRYSGMAHLTTGSPLSFLDQKAQELRQGAEGTGKPAPGMQCEFYPLCRCREECGRG